MKRMVLSLAAAAMLMAGGAASARDVIIGTDVVALTDNVPNMFYQGRAFKNSAFRVSGSSAASNLTAGLAFRFYFERYADSPYVQGDILFGNTTETGAKVGIDLRVGNIIFDPYLSTLSRSFGVNIGLRL
jgi:hypothetical protein